MKRSSSFLLTWLVGILLLAGGAEVTLHQHRDDGAGHSCAVCGAAHASAIPILDPVAATPRLVTRHGVVAVVADVPLDSVRGVAHPRAPPTS